MIQASDAPVADRRCETDRAIYADRHLNWRFDIKLFFVALALAWLICDALLLSPAFGSLDIYYFKDPGANFAQGLGFVSRFTYGNPSFDIFFSYT